jgi:NAD(P)-dependent dehydrogenase (short-subunit alcohol dehydrogenase family)
MTDPTSRWVTDPAVMTNGNGRRSSLDLLHMNPPMLTELRRIIDPITNAGGDRAPLPALAQKLARDLDFAAGPVDLVAGFCEPFTAWAATHDMGVPVADWRVINDLTAASGLITNPSTDAQLAQAWRAIYDYCDAYAATKGAVDAITLILAKELRGRDITVNAVAPGPTATPLFLDGKEQAAIDHLASMPPLERLGTPADIAETVAFLAGPARWVNGQVLYANGGVI